MVSRESYTVLAARTISTLHCFRALDLFTHMREEVGLLNQELIVICHVASHSLTPFISDQLYKTPSEESCVRSACMQDMLGTAHDSGGVFF
jgi:hypothetical protein